jgi:hypothetical protein
VALKGVNQQLSGMSDRFSELRTGTVISVNPFFVIVDVGGTEIEAAYVKQSRPLLTDLVSVMRQGASWFVLGTSSATGGNGILNGSFEETVDDVRPSDWTLYNVTNTANYSAVPDDQAVGDGDRVLEVIARTTATSTSIVYSSPMPVVPGQTVELGAYVNGYYPSINLNTSDGDLRALWFANALNAYPTTSAADTVVATFTNITEIQEGPMRSLSGTAVVPAATNYVRVGLRSIVSSGAGLHWDFATLRVIS